MFAGLQELRYAFEAQFGSDSVRGFDAIAEVREAILSAASLLMETAPFAEIEGRPNNDIIALRNTIGWGPGERPDEIDKKIESAVKTMETICRPFLK